MRRLRSTGTAAAASLLLFGSRAADAAPAGAQSTQPVACVGSGGWGVSCLRDGAWRSFTKASGALASDLVYDMTTCGSRILIAAGNAIHAYDGRAWSAPNPLPRGLARRVSCASGTGYWVAAGTMLFRWTGEAWAEFDTGQILRDQRPKYLNDISAGPAGSVWAVVAGRMAARHDLGGWTLYRDGAGFPERLYLARVLVARDGTVWLPHRGGLTRYLVGEWTTFAGPGPSETAGAVAEGPDGALWLVDRDRLTRFKGGAWGHWTLPARGAAVAASGDGRVWVATEFGLAVFDGSGWTRRHRHDSGLTANRLTAVAVLGTGPGLPGPEERPPGALGGRFVWHSGDPVAGARVELCAAPPAPIPGGAAPCAGKPLLRMASTDAEGRFSVSGLPAATYYLTVLPRADGRWYVSYDPDRSRVDPGERRDSGTWRLPANAPAN